MRTIINGVGTAGPTLAYWLRQTGYEVVLVEKALQRRTGGYIADIWGLGYEIAGDMGAPPGIREWLRGEGGCCVDRHGGKSGGFSVDVLHRLTKSHFLKSPSRTDGGVLRVRDQCRTDISHWMSSPWPAHSRAHWS